MDENEGSEFGAGVVVCLAKFSEHYGTFWEMQVLHAIRWKNMTPEERAKEEWEAKKYPTGDAANRMRDISIVFWEGSGRTDEQQISHAITLWMNGASDHFYDLDRDIAPPSLIELADLCLRIGHGFLQEEIYDETTLKRIRELWQQSCLDVDKRLGTNPDWGTW